MLILVINFCVFDLAAKIGINIFVLLIILDLEQQ